MAHIHTRPGHHDHTVSMCVFRTDLDQPKVLLHMHKKRSRYMPFGGHIELHETPWQAIVHEMKEESGYDIDQLTLLQPKNSLKKLTDTIVHPQPVVHNTHRISNEHFHTDSNYAAITHEPPRYMPADGESTNLQLFSRDEVAGLASDEIFEDIREIILHAFDECLPHWQPVRSSEFEAQEL